MAFRLRTFAARTARRSSLADRARAYLFAIAAASGLVACSALLSLDARQCQSDGDCDSIGPDLVCVQSSCVSPEIPLNRADAGPECTTNVECITRGFEEPAICSKTTRKCVDLKSDTCAYVLPADDVRNDNVVLVGAFIRLGEKAPLSSPIALAYQLALNELREAGGLPGGAGGARRPIAAVFCDAEPSRAEAGIAHLVDTVGVKALIPLALHSDFTRFAQDLTAPKGVFTLNPQDTTVALQDLDLKQLAWQLLGPARDVGAAYRPLFAGLEPFVRRRAGADPARKIRAAIVTSNSGAEKEIEDAVRDATLGIHLNGELVGDGERSGAIVSRRVPSVGVTPSDEINAVIDDVVLHQPEIVALLTQYEGLPMAREIDARLKARGLPLPMYVLSVGNADAMLDYVRSDENEPSLQKRERFLGIQYAASADPEHKAAFLRRMRAAYPKVDQSTYAATENYYDAIYWLAYGLHAAGAGVPVAGEAWSVGVRRLLAGPDVYPGDTRIADALTTISTSTTATFVGALGRPDFDQARGIARSVGALYCYGQDDRDASKARIIYDVRRYDKATATLAGRDTCVIGLQF